MRLLPLLLVALAHVPLLVVYFQQLWDRPHYQFFPLVLLSAGYFLWQRWEFRLPAGPRAVAAARILELLCLPVLVFAFLRLSPMFGYVSFVLIVGSLLLRLGVPALGPWLLLWLVVRLPYGQDVELIQWMQRLTTQLSSTVLEKLGIEHIADGNVILFPTTSLFVEEACSGVVSLLAIVACAGILAVWWRRSIVHSLCLLGTAVFLAGAMNVVRVVTIALALDRTGINLTEGWKHEAVGLAVFAISLAALFSIDRFFSFFLARIPMNPLASYWDFAEGNMLVRMWNYCVGLDQFVIEEEVYGDEDDVEQERAATPGPARPNVFGMAWDWALALAFLAVGGGQVMAGIGPFSVAPEVSPVALNLSEESLPEHLGTWRRVGFEELERDSSSAFGEHSRIWAYQNGTTTVRVSLDFVFPEWHALSACYRGIGWNSQSQQKQTPDGGGTPFVEATFTKPNGDWALLMYDLFDDNGREYEAPSGTFVHPQLRRIFSGQSTRWTLPNYYQVQALAVSNIGELPNSQRHAVAELFTLVRQNLSGQVGGSSETTEAAVPADG